VPQWNLLSLSPDECARPHRDVVGNAAMAVRHLRKPISCRARRALILALRALSPMRELRPGAHCSRSRQLGTFHRSKALVWVSRVPVRSLPEEILQRPAVSAHRSFHSAGSGARNRSGLYFRSGQAVAERGEVRGLENARHALAPHLQAHFCRAKIESALPRLALIELSCAVRQTPLAISSKG
jgi:hypothetical protein